MDPHVEVFLDFIERCDLQNSFSALISDFNAAIAKFGFNYFMMTRLPALGENAEPYVLAHTWPKAWLDHYRANNFFWHDPVSAYSLSQAKPFSWGEAREGSPLTKTAQRIASEAKGLGLVDGIGFPMGDTSSVQAVVSLASDQPVALDAAARALLQMICLHAEMRAVELLEPANPQVKKLTPREREVLRWMANGKSQWETAQILSVSEIMVRIHVANAREKLNAATVSHAVARAIRTRQIIL